jgi:hypothetical protein
MTNEKEDIQVGYGEYSQDFFKKKIEERAQAIEFFGKFNPNQMKEYEQLLEKWLEMHKDDKEKHKARGKLLKTKETGDILEDLVKFIFSSIPMFSYAGKIRTNSNEIDHIVKLSNEGRVLKADNLVDICQNYFIGESKNYDDTISVTWINKLYSLMSSTGTKLGIVFSYHGLTGAGTCRGWQEAKGFAKKVLLASMGLSNKDEDKDAMYILDFNKDHFIKLKETSIIDILEQEKMALKMDAKSEISFFEKHDHEEEIKNIIT